MKKFENRFFLKKVETRKNDKVVGGQEEVEVVRLEREIGEKRMIRKKLNFSQNWRIKGKLLEKVMKFLVRPTR
jgi:hypothetical protein